MVNSAIVTNLLCSEQIVELVEGLGMDVSDTLKLARRYELLVGEALRTVFQGGRTWLYALAETKTVSGKSSILNEEKRRSQKDSLMRMKHASTCSIC